MCFGPPGMLWFTRCTGGKLLNYIAWYLATIACSVLGAGSARELLEEEVHNKTGSHMNGMWSGCITLPHHTPKPFTVCLQSL